MKSSVLYNLTNLLTQNTINAKQCIIDLKSRSGSTQQNNCVISVTSESLGSRACVFAPESYMKKILDLLPKNCIIDIKFRQLSPTEFNNGACLPNSYPLLQCGNVVIASDEDSSMDDMCGDAFFDNIGNDCLEPTEQFFVSVAQLLMWVALMVMLCLFVKAMCQPRSQSLSSQDTHSMNYNTLSSRDENQDETDTEVVAPGANEDEENEDKEDKFLRLLSNV